MEPSKPKREHRLLVVLLILSLAVYAAALVSESHQQSGSTLLSDTIAKINVGLTVTATHADGQVFANRSLPHDLILDQFNDWLANELTSGTGLSLSCTNCGTVGDSSANCSSPDYCGAVLLIGTSGTAPTRSDTALGAAYTPTGGAVRFPDTAKNPVSTTTALPADCNTGTTDKITGISGSQTITSSVTIQEAGLAFHGATGTPLMFHDTFTGIAVVSGDTVTVTYELDLSNSGFNNNLCYLLAGFLAGNIANNGHVQITLTNTVLGTANFYTWCGTSAGNYKIFTTSCGTTTESNYLSIGTGSTAFTTSSTGLTAQAGTYTQITGLAYASPTSFFTTTFNIGSSNTISEMGLFTKLSGAYFLMFALTFTGIAQTANVAFGMTIRMAD